MKVDLNRRDRLKIGKTFTERLISGGHLLYSRSGPSTPGAWAVRLVNPVTHKQQKARIGAADDLASADGLIIFSYDQAKKAALEKLKVLAAKREGIINIDPNNYLISHALDDYFIHLKNSGKSTAKDWRNSANAYLLPEIGGVVASRLTREKVEDLRHKIATSPKRHTRRLPGGRWESVPMDDPYEHWSEEQKRKRKDTANKIISILSFAMTYAIKNGKIPPPEHGSWRDVVPYRGVHGVRTVFLSLEEQRRLVEASGIYPDFQRLILAALYTGGRYSEIASLVVSDFEARQKKVRFGPLGKVKGKIRFVPITDEACEFFTKLVESKSEKDLIFTRKTHRDKKTRGKDGRWCPSDQAYYMRVVSEKAGLKDLTFHGLRHTYASNLVNQGVNLMAVAAALGHRDTTMVQSHYGHLEPSIQDAAIRSAQKNLI